MCGIAGFVSGSPLTSAELRIAAAMGDAIAHRGPDDRAVWADVAAGVAFAHRRLAIVDLSSAGAQPMTSASGRYVIAYNGEIYNQRDLRAELERAGQAPAWRGHSDTEVLLAAIEAYGLASALEMANGMFALALWDRQQRTLQLARDRMGEKPLYYGMSRGYFLFGSELKAIARHPAFDGEIAPAAVAAFMQVGYVPSPLCIWRNFAKLPAGHILTVRNGNRAIGQPTAFWDLAAHARAGAADPLPDDESLSEQVEALLANSVALRMEADVPLGSFLSGGIDSSLVTALMQQRSSAAVRTFSIGFTDPAYDESGHARRVAEHLGTDHTELKVTPADAQAVLPRLGAIWDEPFADSSQIPTYLVSELARRSVTVALSGDAGDELFAGYNRHVLGARIWNGVGWLPASGRNLIARAFRSPALGHAADRAVALLPSRYRVLGIRERLGKIGTIVESSSPLDFYRKLVAAGPGNGVLRDATATAPLPVPQFDDFRNTLVYLDSSTYLPDDILVKVDRASMAVSLESRVPFLDHRLVELAWRVPLSAKIRGGQGKHILRRILYRHVPRELIERPKSGFALPIGTWLATDLRDWTEDLIAPRALRDGGIFDPGEVRALWNRFLAGDRSLQSPLWTILMFQSWRNEQRAGGTMLQAA